MKKIVALVLSLVMVLGLATVAFAYTEGDEYYVKDGASFTKVVFVPAYEEDGEGNVAYFKAAGANYVECKKTDDGAKQLWTGEQAGDSLVAYVKAADVDYTLKGEAVAASPVATCTADKHLKGYKYINAAGVAEYYVDDATSSTFMLVGTEVKEVGKLNEGADVVYGNHMLKLNKTAYLDTAKTIREYKCAVCGQVFQGVTTKAAGVDYVKYTPNANTNNYFDGVGYDKDGAVSSVLYLIAAPAVEAPADKVESAQTFDAGIAMYVGMSVMAAAGSAVVLKKKD